MDETNTITRKLELIHAINDAYRVLEPYGEYWFATRHDTYQAIANVSKPHSIKYALGLDVFGLEAILESAKQLLQANELLFNQPKQHRFFYVQGDYHYMDDDYPDFREILNWIVVPYSDELNEKWLNCQDRSSILQNMYPVNEEGSMQDFQYFSSEAEARLAIYYELCQSHYEYTHDI